MKLALEFLSHFFSRLAEPVPFGRTFDAVSVWPVSLPSSVAFLSWAESTTRPEALSATDHILVVEDDRDTREILAKYLRSIGYHVETASDGIEGLDQLYKHPRSLIFLDLKMPGMDGFEFLQKMHEDPMVSEAPMVLVTGDEEAAQSAAQVQATGILRKPFELDSLLNYAEKYCSLERH